MGNSRETENKTKRVNILDCGEDEEKRKQSQVSWQETQGKPQILELNLQNTRTLDWPQYSPRPMDYVSNPLTSSSPIPTKAPAKHQPTGWCWNHIFSPPDTTPSPKTRQPEERSSGANSQEEEIAGNPNIEAPLLNGNPGLLCGSPTPGYLSCVVWEKA